MGHIKKGYLGYHDGISTAKVGTDSAPVVDDIGDCTQSLVSNSHVGQLVGQGAFTLHGCDLSTGEPKYELAGNGFIYKGE